MSQLVADIGPDLETVQPPIGPPRAGEPLLAGSAHFLAPHLRRLASGNRAGFARAGWEAQYARLVAVLDLLIGGGAAVVAFELRFGLTDHPADRLSYAWITVALPFAWVLACAISRTYYSRYLFVGTNEYERVFRAGLGLTAAVAIFSFTFNLQLARGYILIALPAMTALSIAARHLARRRLHASWARGHRLRRVLLVGHLAATGEMARQLRRERYHGMGVVGACLPSLPTDGTVDLGVLARSPNAGNVPAGLAGSTSSVGGQRLEVPIFGTFDEVALAVQRARADTVVVLSCPDLDGPALRRLAWQLEPDEIDLVVASSLVDVAGDRTTIRPVDGLPLLHVEHARLRGLGRLTKSVVDRLVAGLAVLGLAPLLLAVALLIKLAPGAGGPAIFRQVRVGRHGREFVIYKFRTMYTDAEDRLAELKAHNDLDGTLFKMRNDPRVTPVGRWLRRFSLDEVPQLLNVVRGDMSLVGPRPPLPSEVAEYPADMLRRLVVKPGLTGLWQVSGRSDLSWDESIRLDLRYVENWSLTQDLIIMARTVSAVCRRSGAY